jgi:hypothetical protein
LRPRRPDAGNQEGDGNMRDDDKADEILLRILEAIKPDQGHDNFTNILVALQDAFSFQLGLACPTCRKRLASKLRQNIPGILVKADQLYASSAASTGNTLTCNLH